METGFQLAQGTILGYSNQKAVQQLKTRHILYRAILRHLLERLKTL